MQFSSLPQRRNLNLLTGRVQGSKTSISIAFVSCCKAAARHDVSQQFISAAHRRCLQASSGAACIGATPHSRLTGHPPLQLSRWGAEGAAGAVCSLAGLLQSPLPEALMAHTRTE